MKRMLYLTVWDFQDAESNGICKKILIQVKTLNKMGFEVDFAYSKKGILHLKTIDEDIILGKVPEKLNILLAHIVFSEKLKKRKYDAVYIRHCVASPMYIYLLSVLKKNTAKVVVELPTYPYDDELKSDIRLKLGSLLDKLSRNKMKKYVDRIITYSNHDNIFGIPTIKTMNGVDFESIPPVQKEKVDKSLNLIAVAMFSKWHGYDRLISGLNEYYQQKREVIVKLHMVGDGPEIENYKKIVKEWGLDPYVIFYGNQCGEKLCEIYQKADMAVSSLGLHRIGLNTASTLKDREYGARGLSIVSSHPIDFFPADSEYVYMVPANEEPVNIDQIVNFFQKLTCDHSLIEIGKFIRAQTKKIADMTVTFEPIKRFLMEE